MGLDFLSAILSVKGRPGDADGHLVRRTQSILVSGCPAYQESNIAMEARLSGVACKVRLRGKVCAQKHMPVNHTREDVPEIFFLEIKAFGSFKVAREFLSLLV